MIKVLVEIVAQFVLFLELVDESEISLETVVKQQEELAFRLQNLSEDDRVEFIRLLDELSETESFRKHRGLLERLPEDVGIRHRGSAGMR